MSLNHELNYLLRKLRTCDRYNQFIIIKDIASSIQYANKSDIKLLLELVNTTYDMDLQVKLFSVLTAYLLTNDTNIDIIITCNPMYDKINNILAKNQPQKCTVVLNFLTLLFHTDYEEEGTSRWKSLAIHAKNMIRVSGCLAIMAEQFIGGMMYQDTWRALCLCLAQTCSGSDVNQSFCTNIIPTCVQRCCQRNIEVLPILQSLTNKHERNIQFFLESNGISIFTRELLQYNLGMQLLCTILQTSTAVTFTVQNSNILQDVHDVLRVYGPYSQMGQWATIILFYADSRIKGQNAVRGDQRNEINKSNKTLTSIKNAHTKKPSDGNTTVLFHNVIQEILQWQPKNEIKNPTPNTFFPADIKSNWIQSCERENVTLSNKPLSSDIWMNLQHINRFSNNDRRGNHRANGLNEFTKQNFREPCISSNFNHQRHYTDAKTPSKTKTEKSQFVTMNVTKFGTTSTDTNYTSNLSNSYKGEYVNDNSVMDMEDFKPCFASTPNNNKPLYKNNSSQTSRNLCTSIKTRKHYDTQKTTMSGIKKQKHNDDRTKKKTVCSELKQRSIGSRFFDVINDSCTTLVKTVKSMFTLKKNTNKSKSKEDSPSLRSCSYSFTNYMRNRDAVLADDWRANNNIASEDFSLQIDSCKTCNDTFVLKNKMVKDEYLRQTVKKLKLGINLFGCDFKRISKTMWPRDTYMTPVVLYNLYRKLIIK